MQVLFLLRDIQHSLRRPYIDAMVRGSEGLSRNAGKEA